MSQGTDVVASRAADIIKHMNADHKDSLQAIVTHVQKLPFPPFAARMSSITAQGFTIEYKVVLKSLVTQPGGAKRSVVVPFNPPLKSASDARPRLVALSQEADEKRLKKYPIRYAVPFDLPVMSLALFGIFLLSRPDISDKLPAQLASLFASLRNRLPEGAKWPAFLFKTLIVVHAAEAVAMGAYVWKRGASLLTWLQWTIPHVIIGFPNYFAFQKVNPLISGKKKGKSH